MVSALAAAKAYAAVQDGAKPTGAPPAQDQGPDFGQLVVNAMSDVVKDSRTAEKQMVAQTQGKADMVDVVTAISDAQTSLSTMVAVRDQVISAYQSILNMPI
jgi:flagellar hook-basal body complex protein FliE